MKSKEEIAIQWVDAYQSPRNDEMDAYDAILGALTEYASQQTAAITAERDEYRRALKSITCITLNKLYLAPALATESLFKYPQQ